MTLTIHDKRPRKGMFQAIKDETRNAAIEECARVAETYAKDLWPTAIPRAEFVAAIRALKDKPHEG